MGEVFAEVGENYNFEIYKGNGPSLLKKKKALVLLVLELFHVLLDIKQYWYRSETVQSYCIQHKCFHSNYI